MPLLSCHVNFNEKYHNLHFWVWDSFHFAIVTQIKINWICAQIKSSQFLECVYSKNIVVNADIFEKLTEREEILANAD